MYLDNNLYYITHLYIEFITFTRSFIEPSNITAINTNNNTNTNISNTNSNSNSNSFDDYVALESDGLIIEYLSKHNYDIEYAKIHFLSQLSFGKGKFQIYNDFVVGSFFHFFRKNLFFSIFFQNI